MIKTMFDAIDFLLDVKRKTRLDVDFNITIL